MHPHEEVLFEKQTAKKKIMAWIMTKYKFAPLYFICLWVRELFT